MMQDKIDTGGNHIQPDSSSESDWTFESYAAFDVFTYIVVVHFANTHNPVDKHLHIQLRRLRTMGGIHHELTSHSSVLAR